jgi:colanic acid biosynthesis glycosyl transferase WcaI
VRVHIIGINYWPEQTGIAVFSTGRAEYLAAKGHQVTMCTAVPYYPQWRVLEEYRGRGFRRESRAGVDIHRCPLYVPRRVTTVRRMLHEASFVVAAFLRSLCAPRPDVVVVVSPPLGLAVAAVLLSLWWRVPYLFDVEDLQPDTAVDLGMVRPGLFTRILYAVERLAYRHAAAVSTLTESMRERIIEKGVSPATVQRLGLWVDPELLTLDVQQPDAELRRELGVGDAFLVLHIGNMGVKQGLDVVIEAARSAPEDAEIRYVLVGDGAVRAALEARSRDLGLSNFSIVPLMPRDRFLRLLATADVCLVTQQRSVADVVFPSKVLTLLASGKPVVAAVSPESAVARAITAAGAGIVVEPENPAALRDAIERLRDDLEMRRRMGARGREYSRRQWDRESTLQRLESTLERLALSSATAEPVRAD